MADRVAAAGVGAEGGPVTDVRPTVVVAGGGIAGLAAAWELSGGAGGPRPDGPSIVVLETDDRLGGKLQSARFAGTVVDLGPDGVLGRRPEAVALCQEVGLGNRLAPIGAAGASVWVGGRARALPGALALGVPTRFLPVARSGILGSAGALRLLVDVVVPRPNRRGPIGDRAIGPLIARKLGRRVVDRLVDPLLGGIYAGRVEDASAAAVYPLLLDAAQQRRSFMRALRHAVGAQAPAPGDARPAPAFWALDGGFDLLVDRLGAALAGRGVSLRAGTPATRLERTPASARPWTVHTPDGPIPADGVVLATPAGATADLLAPHDGEAANLLRTVEYASVAVVTLDLAPGAVPHELKGTGMLVPPATRLPSALAEILATADPHPLGPEDGQFLITACTFLSRKWPHLAAPDRDLVRVSVGRFGDRRFVGLDDEQLAARVAAEVGALIGTDARPRQVLVTRWPEALPQYRVHHLMRVAGVQAAVERLGAVTVAGAAYSGVGVPACVASGREAARVLSGRLGVPTETG